MIRDDRGPVVKASEALDINGGGRDGGATYSPSRAPVRRTNSVTPANRTPLLATDPEANKDATGVSDEDEDDDVQQQPLAGSGAGNKARPSQFSLPHTVGSYFLTAADADAELLDDSDEKLLRPPTELAATTTGTAVPSDRRGRDRRDDEPATESDSPKVPFAHRASADDRRRRTLRNRWWLYLTLASMPTLRKLRRHSTSAPDKGIDSSASGSDRGSRTLLGDIAIAVSV